MPENYPIPVMSLPLGTFTTLIGNVTRWRILSELAKGVPLLVMEMARSTGYSQSVVSKNLALMRKFGAVFAGRGRMYEIPAHFRIGPGLVDFGHGVLRMSSGV